MSKSKGTPVQDGCKNVSREVLIGLSGLTVYEDAGGSAEEGAEIMLQREGGGETLDAYSAWHEKIRRECPDSKDAPLAWPKTQLPPFSAEPPASS